ncbi:universal stress protein [Mycobacterium tuberculosis variant bovis B2 7505]|nr:universal stress protein [Mycobacterium tuberculosis variant bovis B2 7505]
MSAATAKYGILVGVDGSAQSNAAVAWAAREAVMRQLPITLLHIVAPVVVGWPVGQLYANMTEWQKDNAQQVIEQAREALTNSLGESKPPQVHTELVFSNVVPTLIDASQQAWLMVVGSQGMGALGRLLLGSISTALLHHARCPVAIIHSDAYRCIPTGLVDGRRQPGDGRIGSTAARLDQHRVAPPCAVSSGHHSFRRLSMHPNRLG